MTNNRICVVDYHTGQFGDVYYDAEAVFDQMQEYKSIIERHKNVLPPEI
jgi:hypothetical protein